MNRWDIAARTEEERERERFRVNSLMGTRSDGPSSQEEEGKKEKKKQKEAQELVRDAKDSIASVR